MSKKIFMTIIHYFIIHILKLYVKKKYVLKYQMHRPRTLTTIKKSHKLKEIFYFTLNAYINIITYKTIVKIPMNINNLKIYFILK